MSKVSADRPGELSARVCAELEVITSGIMFGAADPEEIDVHESLVDLGFDSITLLDLLEKINKRFSIEIDLLAITDYPSLTQLASYIVERHMAELAPALNPAGADDKAIRSRLPEDDPSGEASG